MPDVNARLDLFKQAALSQGFPQEEIDQFLSESEVKNVLGRQEREAEVEFEPFLPETLEPGVSAPSGQIRQDLGDFRPVEGQTKVLASAGPVTQRFGSRSRVEVFSGGFNRGTDFGVPTGTKVAAPQGNWVVEESFGGSRKRGFIGNSDNGGYGNSVVLRNQQTGERLRFSHLSRVGVRPGQTIKGGQVVALSGQSGNVTGPHLDVEYIDQRGRLRDVLKSKYRGQIA